MIAVATKKHDYPHCKFEVHQIPCGCMCRMVKQKPGEQGTVIAFKAKCKEHQREVDIMAYERHLHKQRQKVFNKKISSLFKDL